MGGFELVFKTDLGPHGAARPVINSAVAINVATSTLVVSYVHMNMIIA